MPEQCADILDEIPEDFVLPFCETVLAKELPLSIYAYSLTKTLFGWRNKDRTYDVSFYYCPENIESGIFVGILKTGEVTFGLIVHANEGYDDLLQKVLLCSNKIKWQELPLVQGILPRLVKLIEDVIKQKGLYSEIYVDSTVQLLPIEKALNYQIVLPDDFYADSLTGEHVDFIYDLWPLKDVHTVDDLKYAIKLGPSFGIFSKSTNELFAWIMQSHYGAVGMLYTKEPERRKGFARILVKLMSKKLAEIGVQPYAMIVEANKKSLDLFHSLGYKQITLMKYLRVLR